ncbi:hypothetical protein [Dyadobacter crusticola]|uniref:hypothetical protein n=1 Tax=Dyadobacter crusticola TaxID=292407 RepID=UPI000ABBB92F|nr:hypothetical protein [Dyadobacter crusticola]
MRSLFALFLACSFGAFAQKIHLPHEVEKVAEPAGGNPLLMQFLTQTSKFLLKAKSKESMGEFM